MLRFPLTYTLETDTESKKTAKDAHALLLAEYNKNEKRIKQVTARLKSMGHKTSTKRSAGKSADPNASKKIKTVCFFFGISNVMIV